MEIENNEVKYYNGEFAHYWKREDDPFAAVLGKTITSIEFDGDSLLTIRFEDGTGVSLFDDGQSCCESRYMTTDDNLSSFVGSSLVGGTIKDAPDGEGYEAHEIQFLEIRTSTGTFTMANHNEHNGYYGGFSVRAVAIGARHLNY